MMGRMLDRLAKIQILPPEARRRPQPEEGPLSVLFEDESVVVLDKPAGVVVHPTYKHSSGTLLNAVLWRYRDREGLQPGILTRLDKDTSGIVVVALTPTLHATMQRDMGAGRVTKEYLAVVHGVPDPPAGRISLPLGRSSEDRRVVVVREDGAACETLYEVVGFGLRASGLGLRAPGSGLGALDSIERQTDSDIMTAVVRCELITGRTHQIRVHLAARGWPIIGDRVYGEGSVLIPRQALHAWRVTFSHPVTRAPITVTSPTPNDMTSLVSSTMTPESTSGPAA